MIRLGLCCLFVNERIHFRTTTATYLKRLDQEKALLYLNEIILHNLASLLKAILYCSSHRIGSFRITSRFLPLYTHPEAKYSLKDLSDHKKIKSLFGKCKKLAKEKNIRLTLHPDQFVVINSPNEQVVTASLKELEYHGLIASLLGVDVINIHAGGVYGDKRSALERFRNQVRNLSSYVLERLTIENDDRNYTPEDLLPLAKEVGIPFVYDVHHHRCLPDALSIEEVTERSLETWNREPLFHLSSPLCGWEGKNRQNHHDYISIDDFPLNWLKIDPLTVEIEAKAKEEAISDLWDELQKIVPLYFKQREIFPL